MIDIYELTERDLRSWDDAMADESPPLYPTLDGKLFWLMLGRYTQPIAKAA